MNAATLHLLQEAAHEIRMLRRRLDIAQAKIEVLDILGLALKAPAPGPQAGSPDVLWMLERELDSITVESTTDSQSPADAGPDAVPAN